MVRFILKNENKRFLQGYYVYCRQTGKRIGKNQQTDEIKQQIQIQQRLGQRQLKPFEFYTRRQLSAYTRTLLEGFYPLFIKKERIISQKTQKNQKKKRITLLQSSLSVIQQVNFRDSVVLESSRLYLVQQTVHIQIPYIRFMYVRPRICYRLPQIPPHARHSYLKLTFPSIKTRSGLTP